MSCIYSHGCINGVKRRIKLPKYMRYMHAYSIQARQL